MAAGGIGFVGEEFLDSGWEQIEPFTVWVDAVFTECLIQSLQNVATFEFDLLKLGGFKNEIEGDVFIEGTLSLDGWINLQVEAMALGAIAHKSATRMKCAGVDEGADTAAEVGFVAVALNLLAEGVYEFTLICVQGLGSCPFGQATYADIASVDAVDNVVQGVSGVVGPIHNLAFDTLEFIECLSFEKVCGEGGSAKDLIAPLCLLVVNKVVLGCLACLFQLVALSGFILHDPVKEGAGRRNAFGASRAFVDKLG